LVLSPPEPPFIALIAVSGQKHLAFRARVALGKSMFPVQFESERLWVRRENLEETLTIYEKLLALGCSKTAVDTGKYKYSRLKEHWVEIERLETELQSMRYGRGSAGFSLVGFIARKPEKEKKRG
jgi:CRISPR type IV-associated protein Csf1